MMATEDQNWIKNNSKEIIEGSGELIVRKRLKIQLPPGSYDSDFAEVVKASEENYDTLEFTGKVFWDVTEKVLQEMFGADTQAQGIVHVPIDTDVRPKDLLVIRGLDYEISQIAEAPLRGMKVCGLLIRSAQ